VAGLSNAVFAGTVVSIQEEQLESRYWQIVARFQIQNVFKGLALDQKTVEVRTGHGGGDCGVSFKVGETYLVYAHSSEGVLHTSICSRTRPLAEARDDIPLIESFLVGKKLTALLGTVYVTGNSSSMPAGLDRSAAEGLEVEVRGSRQSFRTTVDSQGLFRVWNVPEGTYTVRLVLGAAYEQLSGKPHKVSMRVGACSADTYVYFPARGVASGRILTSSGMPVVIGTKVSLFDTNPSSGRPQIISSRTDADGRVRFESLLPGRYIVNVGDVFYGMDLSNAPIIDLRSTWGARIDIQFGK